MMVPLDALVADPAVDHHNGDPHSPAGAQEVRPQLRLNRQENARRHAAHHVRRQKRKIKRKINDRVRPLNNAVRHLVAVRRDDRQQNRIFRELTPKFFDEWAGRHHFADGSSMDPYAVLLGDFFQRRLGNDPQALTDPFHKAPLADRTDHEHRNDEQHYENRRDII